MHASPLIVGLDVGTTNIKALAAEPDGSIVGAASVPTPTHVPRPGWAYYEPDEIWSTVCDVLTELTSQVTEPDRIAGIAVASIGETAFPIDDSGQPTYHGIAWYDARSRPQADWLSEHIGADRIYRTCRMSIQPIYGLCKLLWMRDNQRDAFAKTTAWLNTADYVAYRLSGEMATDPSLASRALLFDVERYTWADEILADCGVSTELLPPFRRSGDAIGTVQRSAAECTGLPESAVVATGGHDHVCGALGVGVTEPGTVLNSLGTAEALFLPIAKPLNKPEVARQGYSVGGHVAWDRYYAIGGLYTSGASVDWIKRLLAADDDLNKLAEDVSPGCGGVLFMPHLRIANPPFGDAPSRGAFVGLTGDVDPAILYRSVLEGIAFEARLCLEGLLSYADLETPDEILAIGGSTRNALLMKIKASVYDTPITVSDTEEGTALGAAILGGLGAGVYESIENVHATVRHETHTVEPDVELAKFYTELRQTYSAVYPALKDLNARIESQGD